MHDLVAIHHQGTACACYIRPGGAVCPPQHLAPPQLQADNVFKVVVTHLVVHCGQGEGLPPDWPYGAREPCLLSYPRRRYSRHPCRPEEFGVYFSCRPWPRLLRNFLRFEDSRQWSCSAEPATPIVPDEFIVVPAFFIGGEQLPRSGIHCRNGRIPKPKGRIQPAAAEHQSAGNLHRFPTVPVSTPRPSSKLGEVFFPQEHAIERITSAERDHRSGRFFTNTPGIPLSSG